MCDVCTTLIIYNIKTEYVNKKLSKMKSNNSLDKFGHFLVRNMRDNAIDFFDKLIEGYYKATTLQKIHQELSQFTSEQKDIIRKSFIAGIDTSIHDFLFALEEIHETADDIQIMVDGENVVRLSEELHRELLTKDGWFSRFSHYVIEF